MGIEKWYTLSVESNGVDSNVRVTANRIGPGRRLF